MITVNRTFLFLSLAILTVLSGAGCESSDKMEEKQIEYTYSDGSNNTWRLEGNNLRYEPVQPAMSSSGVYSGGEAYNLTLSSNESEEIRHMLEETFKAEAEHSELRSMGTGMVVRKNDGVTKSVILLSDSDLKTQIEDRLQKYESD